MENYVEITHEYEDPRKDLNRDVWWAVRPSTHSWQPRGGTWESMFPEPWTIKGDVVIYDQSDIDGLRKLLDKLEELL